jgi:acetyltransferase
MLHLFYPRSVVIVGVSDETDNLGRIIVDNLDRASFNGEVYLVGLQGGRLNNRQIYRDVDEVPGKPELTVVLTPAKSTPEILDACGRKGIRRAIIESGGFSEYSEDGKLIERQLVKVAKQHGIRFIGPNCIGVMNLENGLILPFVRVDTCANRKGSISVISQSGGVVNGLVKLFSDENLGFNKFISLGNKLDLNENDCLDYLIKDPGTAIIGLYLESISDGRELIRLATSTEKPIIALKANTNSACHEIAHFHTSALAGDDQVCSAAFAQAGIHRVYSLGEFIDHLKVFMLPLMGGPHLAVIGRSGGHNVMAADAAGVFGFVLPKFSKELLDRIRRQVRGNVIRLTNPLDLGDVFDLESYIQIVEEVLKEEQVHGVLLRYLSLEMGAPQRLISAIEEYSRRYAKPVILCLTANQDEWLRVKAATDYPFFREARSALQALAASYRHSKRRAGGAISISSLEKDNSSSEPSYIVSPEKVFSFCESLGISIADFVLVEDMESTLSAAQKIGYPVALKIASVRVLHKTEVNGVRTGIQDERSLQNAFRELEQRFSSIFHKNEYKFLVQKMAPPGIEVILGGKRDPEFGPVVLFGMGGVFTEVFRDVAVRVAPVSGGQAIEMINQTKGSILMKGFRGQPLYDVESLLSTILTFSKILIDFPGIYELEINPFFVLPKGQGCIAVDGRMRVKGHEKI